MAKSSELKLTKSILSKQLRGEAGYMSGYYIINGKKIYVYMGNSSKIPVLYIHGAPGIGVLDMEKYQSENFYPNYFLIAPEQRGVWRSEDLKEDEPYSMDLIIEDYEQLRKQLKIEKWIVLCHCIGARTALEYYRRHPESVLMILCENPVFDSLSAFEQVIRIQLSFVARKSLSDFELLSKELQTIKNPLDLEKFCQKLEKKTSIQANNLTMSKETIKKLSKIKTDFDIDLFMRSRKTEIKMSHCESLYEKIYDIMESVKVPMLVMFGQNDVTVSKNALARVKNQVRECEFKEFKNCKHWIHLDSEQEYFECVDGFIKKNLA